MALYRCGSGGGTDSQFTCAYNGINQSTGKLVAPVPSSGTINVTIGGGIMVLNKQFKNITISNISNNIFYFLYDDNTSKQISAGTHDASKMVAIYANGGNLNTRYSYSYSLS